MMRVLILSGLFVLILFPPGVHSQEIEFYREDILFTIYRNAAQVNGEYHFCNTSNKNCMMTLFYPFPGNTIEQVDSLFIENLKTKDALPYRRSGPGIYFDIYVKSYETSAYRIYFRQQLDNGHFKYILLSTENWGKPIEFASYELQTSLSLILDSLSYLPDTTFMSNDSLYCKWKMKEFMPDRDFEVFFH